MADKPANISTYNKLIRTLPTVPLPGRSDNLHPGRLANRLGFFYVTLVFNEDGATKFGKGRLPAGLLVPVVAAGSRP
jgi:hypothetical protein